MNSPSHKQVVMLSGKGGTGKTTITGAFAELLKNKILIDCDVDAANLYLLLNPKLKRTFPYSGEKKANIDMQQCSKCGLCEELCRFDAISEFVVNEISCEGCGLCFRACPEQAISFEPHQSGSYYDAEVSDGAPFFYARLLPGEGNSGKLVSEIRKYALQKADEKTEWVLIDGPPGIGCPVNASITGVDYAVIVTEPTLSGVHDLERLIALLSQFQIAFGIIINKYDLNVSVSEQIAELAADNNAPILGTIPFNNAFVEAVQQNKTIVAYDADMKNLISTILGNVIKILKN